MVVGACVLTEEYHDVFHVGGTCFGRREGGEKGRRRDGGREGGRGVEEGEGRGKEKERKKRK